MNTLTELQKENIMEHMLHEEDVLKKKYKAKSSEFDEISILHNEIEDYEKDGFFCVRTTSRKAYMRKPKSPGIKFEDDIWSMFYGLGFRILNKDEHLTIQWGPNPEDKQQLDVVAIDDNAIFVVECKAATTPTTRSFKSEINKMEQYMEGVASALRQVYGTEKKVKFIFATRNFRFIEDGEDVTRLNNNGIYHLKDNTYNYIRNLIKSYKSSVIYQFYGLMFKNELFSDTELKIPALKGTMGGHEYYTFSIEPSTLLKIGFVLHRTKVNDSMAPTYQRLLVPSRLGGITKFIDGGGFFPNSIIINFDAPNDKLKIRFSSIKAETDSLSQFGFLHIPNAYGIAYIIDGQHRVYGYAQSKFKDSNTIPVVAFENMTSEEQLKIFMEINENQKAVSPSLKLDLEEDLFWDSNRVDSRMKALRSSIIKALSNDSNYILYNKISIGEDPAKLAFKPFDTALNHSGLIPKAKNTEWTGNTDTCLYNTKNTDTGKEMVAARTAITKFINGAYAIADQTMSEEAKMLFLLSNRATYAFITLVGSIHAYLIQTNVIQPNSSTNERVKAIEPYIEKLSTSLNNISEEDKNKLIIYRGQGADTYWLRYYQNIIYKYDSDFCPEELTKWLETQDKDIQETGNNYKTDIKKQLRKLVFALLDNISGGKMPSDIAILKNTVEGRIIKEYGNLDNFEMTEYDWKDFLEISEYRDIISRNFSNELFSETFTINIGLPCKTKNEKLAWMNLLLSKGNKNVPMTRSVINQLEVINSHFANIDTI